MSDTSIAAQDSKKCFACGNSIPIGATLCTHCKSYQDWRRVFGFSTTALALLTALVSVSTTGAPVILQLIRGDNSNIAVSYQGIYRRQAVKMVAFNSGNRPATIGSVSLGAVKFDSAGRPSKEQTVELGVNEAESIEAQAISIGPGQSNNNFFYLGPNNKKDMISFVFDNNGNKIDCFVRFTWIDFATTEVKRKEFPFDCIAITTMSTSQ
jgi:hypothetical protein